MATSAILVSQILKYRRGLNELLQLLRCDIEPSGCYHDFGCFGEHCYINTACIGNTVMKKGESRSWSAVGGPALWHGFPPRCRVDQQAQKARPLPKLARGFGPFHYELLEHLSGRQTLNRYYQGCKTLGAVSHKINTEVTR